MRQVPFLRLLAPFALGIGLGMAWAGEGHPLSSPPALLAGFALLLLTLPLSARWAYRWAFGLGCVLFFALAGMVLHRHAQAYQPHAVGVEVDLVVTLLEPLEARTTTQRALARLEGVRGDGEWQADRQKLLLYFRRSDTLAQGIGYGAQLAIRGELRAPATPQNPNQFNYSKYLERRGVRYICFVRPGSWQAMGERANPVVDFAFRMRERLLGLFARAGLEGSQLAIASALTMGYRGLLDEETQRVYAATGATHILAVSGQHVGILFVVASWALFFLNRFTAGRYLKATLIIAFLWMYALFTGLSASVVRASLMFSLILAGGTLHRHTSIYNTLCSSALILLIINPMLIADVGFQLSYMAVLSIVFFYPYVYRLAPIGSRWLGMVWALIAASVAAQLGTFALGFHYFHQFPTYFLLTNLHAIPLATAALYSSILLIALSPIEWAAHWVGWALNGILGLKYHLLGLTESLPAATIQGVNLPAPQLALLLGALVLGAIYLERRQGQLLAGGLAMLLAIGVMQGVDGHRASQRCETVVFAVRGHTAIGFTTGRTMLLLHSDSLSDEPQRWRANPLRGYLNPRGGAIHMLERPLPLAKGAPGAIPHLEARHSEWGLWVQHGPRLVFIPNGAAMNAPRPATLGVDLLVITSGVRRIRDEWVTQLNPKLVVIDSSVPAGRARRMADRLKGLGARVHLVSVDGAVVVR